MKLLKLFLIVSLIAITLQTERVERANSKLKSKTDSKKFNIKSNALSNLKSTSRLTSSTYAGWIRDNASNSNSLLFTLQLQDVNPPQSEINKRGMVFKMDEEGADANSVQSLKGQMIKYLEKATWGNSSVWVIPYRHCNPISFYNPFIKRKYIFANCAGQIFHFIFSYLDIPTSEANEIVGYLEKNRRDRINWINKIVRGVTDFATQYIEADRNFITASQGMKQVRSSIDLITTEIKSIADSKKTEENNYNTIQGQLEEANHKLATLKQQRKDFETKIAQQTILISETTKQVDGLTTQKESGTVKTEGFKAAATQAKENFLKQVELLKVEASSDSGVLASINIDNYEPTVAAISGIIS